jgi:hypothetical protein
MTDQTDEGDDVAAHSERVREITDRTRQEHADLIQRLKEAAGGAQAVYDGNPDLAGPALDRLRLPTPPQQPRLTDLDMPVFRGVATEVQDDQRAARTPPVDPGADADADDDGESGTP